MFAFGESVVFEAATLGTKDSHGNRTVTFAPGVKIDGWGFDPGGSVESVVPGRNAVVSSPQLIRQATDFVPSRRDRCTIRGKVFQVDGDPAVWRSPLTGWEPGVVVKLEAVSG